MTEWARRQERAFWAKVRQQAAVQEKLDALRAAGQLDLFGRPAVQRLRATATGPVNRIRNRTSGPSRLEPAP